MEWRTANVYSKLKFLLKCFFLHQIYAGIFESIAIIISIFTVTRYGIQRNIFYNILLAGISLMYVAVFPNADWTLVVGLSMLGLCYY